MSKLLRITHIYLTKILFVVGLTYVYLMQACPSCDAKTTTTASTATMANQNTSEQTKTRKTQSMTDENKMAEGNQPNNNNAHDSQMASQATENQGY